MSRSQRRFPILLPFALDAFDKEKNISGTVSNAVNRGAGRIAAGESAKAVE